MSGTKKAALDVATIENGTGQISFSGFYMSETYYTTALKPQQGLLDCFTASDF